MKTAIEMPDVDHRGEFMVRSSLTGESLAFIMDAEAMNNKPLARFLIKYHVIDRAAKFFSGHEVTVTFEPFFAECKRIEYKARLA